MHQSRTLLAVALTSIALVAVAVPAAAHQGDGDTHRGQVGRHGFIDTEAKLGARCIYRAETTDVAIDALEPGRELAGVSARPPKVAAANRTRSVDRQLVAWRFVLQEKVGDGDWTKVKRSRTQIRRATDHRAAAFTRLAVRYDGNPEAEYRVKTKAFWLGNRNPLKKVGAATHLVNYYKVGPEVAKTSCAGGIPASVAP